MEAVREGKQAGAMAGPASHLDAIGRAGGGSPKHRSPSPPRTRSPAIPTPKRAWQASAAHAIKESPEKTNAKFEAQLGALQAEIDEEEARIAELLALEKQVRTLLEKKLSEDSEIAITLPPKTHDVGVKTPLGIPVAGMFFDERERRSRLHDAREKLRLNRLLARSVETEVERMQSQLDGTSPLSGAQDAHGGGADAPTEAPAEAAAAQVPDLVARAPPPAPLEMDEDEMEELHERLQRVQLAIKEKRFSDFRIALPSFVDG